MSDAGVRPKAQLEPWPVRIQQLVPLRREYVTPKMIRVTLGGPEHVGFESHIADEHVKLLFPDPPEDHTRIPTQNGDHLSWPKPLVPSRDYTVRRCDSTTGEVDIDIVVHEGGVGSTWAVEAPLGEAIWVAGPPRGIRIPDTFSWQMYIGDETALPAIAHRREEIPAHLRGIVLVEVADEGEMQDLECPPGFEIRWIIRGGRPAGSTSELVSEAKKVSLPPSPGTYVWFGGEQSAIKPLRAWVKEAGLVPGEFDLTGYWRHGKHGNQLTAGDVLHAVKHMLHIPHRD